MSASSSPAQVINRKKLSYMQRLVRNIRAYPMFYIMILPVVAYYLIFKYIPLFGNIIAFKNYRPARGFINSRWVGLQYFNDFLTGPYAYRVIRNTIQISLLQLAFGFPAPIILAILFNEMKPGYYKRVTQTLSYLPYFVSLVVVCGIVKEFCASSGLFGDIQSAFGLTPINLLTTPSTYRSVYVCTSIWQSCGWSSILYLATLTNADQQLYEAAVIDGANRFQQMVHITLPTLVPIIVVQLIMRIGHLMSTGSERTILLYSSVVYDQADIISSFVYRYGLQQLNFSYGTAVDVFNSIVNLILLVGANKLADKLTGESLW